MVSPGVLPCWAVGSGIAQDILGVLPRCPPPGQLHASFNQERDGRRRYTVCGAVHGPTTPLIPLPPSPGQVRVHALNEVRAHLRLGLSRRNHLLCKQPARNAVASRVEPNLKTVQLSSAIRAGFGPLNAPRVSAPGSCLAPHTWYSLPDTRRIRRRRLYWTEAKERQWPRR